MSKGIVGWLSITICFVSLCYFGKGCNDSDNHKVEKMFEYRCQILKDGKMECGK